MATKRLLLGYPWRRAHCLPLLSALLLVLCFGTSASAQLTPPPGYSAKLLSIDAVGSKAYSVAQVTQVSGISLGATVNLDAIQAAANRLAHSGLFSAVHYRYATDVGGLRVTFELQDAPFFPISFDNFPWFTDDELFNALQQAGIPLRDAAPASGPILDDISQTLEKTLATRGVHATVAHGLVTHPVADNKILEFRVVGASLKIGSVQFSDSLAANDSSIRSQFATLIGKPFSRLLVEQLIAAQVRPLYLSHAFLHVHFGSPTAGFSGNPQGPLPKEVVVVVPIEPGPVYRWNSLSWSGNHVFSAADLDTLAKTEGLTPGEPADGMKILALWDSLHSAYAHRGYLDAQIDPAENINEAAHQAAYRVTISEGIQYRMGKLVLSGLNPESEQRIRQAWRIPQGEVFDQSFFDDFLARGIAEALKGLPASRDKIGNFLQKYPDNGIVDVLLDFE